MVNRNRDKLSLAGRIVNSLGVLAWGGEDKRNEEPFLRRLHPLTVLLIVAAVVVILLTGRPITGLRELWEDIQDHTVWWFAPKSDVDWLPLPGLKQEQQQGRKF